MASAYCVLPAVPKRNLAKTGDRRIPCTSGAASMIEGLPCVVPASKESVRGTRTTGITVVAPCAGSWPASVKGTLLIRYWNVGAVLWPDAEHQDRAQKMNSHT